MLYDHYFFAFLLCDICSTEMTH